MSVTDSPIDGGIGDLPSRGDGHITREEFNSLLVVVGRTARSVGRIEKAIIGDNPMRPDPESLAMRVDSHDKSIRFASKISLAALIGTLGMIGKMAWTAMIGGAKP